MLSHLALGSGPVNGSIEEPLGRAGLYFDFFDSPMRDGRFGNCALVLRFVMSRVVTYLRTKYGLAEPLRASTLDGSQQTRDKVAYHQRGRHSPISLGNEPAIVVAVAEGEVHASPTHENVTERPQSWHTTCVCQSSKGHTHDCSLCNACRY